ncbi:MAG: alanine racemase [Pontibacterium sp.]
MYYRDTWVEVDLDRIAENVSNIKRHAGFENLFAVVKANAYGHGDIEVARAALQAGATQLSVAFLDEALKLRREIKEVPVLVMGPVRPTDIAVAAEQNIDITAHDLAWIEAAMGYEGVPANVHLKIDSGMHRIGLTSQAEFSKACEWLDAEQNLNLVGLFTHFATADGSVERYQGQLNKVATITEGCDLSRFRYVHQSNSAALLHHPQQPGANGGRLGIAMYGLAPSDTFELPCELKQAFSLHSRITQIKQLKAGDTVGYGATYEADETITIGVISIGYADGWLRYHQNRPVEINGKEYSIVGRVCMDQTMIRIDDRVKVGDQVNLINDRFTVDAAANDLDTINYEIVCAISDRVPRVYKQGGQTVSVRNDRFK